MTREEAIDCINAIHVQMFNSGNSKWTEACDMAIEALKEQSIIHCKDCEYYRTPERYSYKEPNPYCCRSALMKVSENDFCSKAIPKAQNWGKDVKE